MYEPYYAPLPDADAYLKRIGVERKAPCKEYLDELIYAHQCNVVFENLDICDLRRHVSIKTADVFEKVVVNGRGGYCFELNGLFVKLLQVLGFEAWSCPCRVVRDPSPFMKPVRHRGTIVKIDGKYYFCDVGFGGAMPCYAVEVTDGLRQSKGGETFWFERKSDFWWNLMRLTKGKNELSTMGPVPPDEDTVKVAPVLLVSPAEWENVDFISANEDCQAPDATFYLRRGLNLRRPDGYIALTGDLFARLKNGVRERREVDEAEAQRIIKEEFGLIVK